MILRIMIQILFIGIMGGYIAYKQDHKIESTLEPAPLWYWLIVGLLFPLSFMWFMFLDALEKKN